LNPTLAPHGKYSLSVEFAEGKAPRKLPLFVGNAKRGELVWDGVWGLSIIADSNFIQDKVSFGDAGCSASPAVLRSVPKRELGNASAFRLVSALPPTRLFCVYLPLVSLRCCPDRVSQVGDFNTLVELASWAKRVGITQIHVHLEMLEHHLIDPIHAVIPYEVPSEFTISAIRDAKLAALWGQYTQWKSTIGARDLPFSLFKRTFPWIASFCTNEFAHWLQCLLFRQLERAFERMVRIGVQLILDFAIDGPEKEPLLTFARFAHGIRIVGLDNYLQPVTEDYLRAFFRQDSEFILRSFFEVTEFGVFQKPEFSDQSAVDAVLRSVPSQGKRHELAGKIGFIKRRQSEPDTWSTFLPDLCKNVACAIVLDAPATQSLGSQRVVKDFMMIPSASEPTPNGIVVPVHMSPEMVSEFPGDVDLRRIQQAMEQRAQTDAVSVTVYLNDLLVITGVVDRAAPEPLQLISGHCRFTFPMSVRELAAEPSRRLTDWLAKMKRDNSLRV
jgi:hypothetical protein